jgi:hypothetical protein
MTTTENVVYTYEPESNPAIRYRSIPSGCSGTAATLDEARSSYRADLTRLLGVERRDLPPVVEHVEAIVNGMWVRERVGTVHRDHNADRMLLQTLLAPGPAQEELRAYVHTAADRGCQPVVLLAEPEEPVAAVLSQMTPHDAVVVAYSDAECEVGWAAVYGPQAQGANEIPPVSWDSELLSMPIGKFARAHRNRRAVRMSTDALREAS